MNPTQATQLTFNEIQPNQAVPQTNNPNKQKKNLGFLAWLHKKLVEACNTTNAITEIYKLACLCLWRCIVRSWKYTIYHRGEDIWSIDDLSPMSKINYGLKSPKQKAKELSQLYSKVYRIKNQTIRNYVKTMKSQGDR